MNLGPTFEMLYEHVLKPILIPAGVSAGVLWSLRTWFSEQITKSVEHKFEQKLERFKAEIRNAEMVHQTRWEIKRKACLNALRMVDIYMANQDWGSAGVPEKQGENLIAEARAVCNELAVSCDSDEVLRLYKACLGISREKKLKGDAIVDLRTAIRRELGFGLPLSEDREYAWIARLNPLPQSVVAVPAPGPPPRAAQSLSPPAINP